MKFRLTTFDVVRICGYVIATGALLTPSALHYLGLPQNDASNVAEVIGRIVFGATLISNVIRNPSPPSGTQAALIPTGSIPVVTAAVPGTGHATVAQADPATVLAVTSATIAPPAQKGPTP